MSERNKREGPETQPLDRVAVGRAETWSVSTQLSETDRPVTCSKHSDDRTDKCISAAKSVASFFDTVCDKSKTVNLKLGTLDQSKNNNEDEEEGKAIKGEEENVREDNEGLGQKDGEENSGEGKYKEEDKRGRDLAEGEHEGEEKQEDGNEEQRGKEEKEEVWGNEGEGHEGVERIKEEEREGTEEERGQEGEENKGDKEKVREENTGNEQKMRGENELEEENVGEENELEEEVCPVSGDSSDFHTNVSVRYHSSSSSSDSPPSSSVLLGASSVSSPTALSQSSSLTDLSSFIGNFSSDSGNGEECLSRTSKQICRTFSPSRNTNVPRYQYHDRRHIWSESDLTGQQSFLDFSEAEIERDLNFLKSCGDKMSTPDHRPDSARHSPRTRDNNPVSFSGRQCYYSLDEMKSSAYVEHPRASLTSFQPFPHGLSPLCKGLSVRPARDTGVHDSVRRSLTFGSTNLVAVQRQDTGGFKPWYSSDFASEDEEAVYHLITKYLEGKDV